MTRRTMIASAILVVLAALLGWRIPPAAASTTTSDSQTFAPVADAFVSAATPRRNYGTSRRMYADVDPIMRSFMRFNVQDLRGPIVSASLRVYVVRGSGTGYRIRKVASGHWGERTITYANRPRPTGPARASGRLRSGSWTALDVSSLITDDGLVSFSLATRSSSTVTIRSREARRKGPRLIVKTERDVQAPTAPTNLVASDQTATSLSLSWDEPTDDVGTVGYRIYVNASEVGTATAPGHTVSSLNCGTMYTFGVEAYDLANNTSERATVNASTEACSSNPSPPSSCTYYVNARTGDDTNAGTSEAAPWGSLSKVTDTALGPGQTVCFARDSVWSAEQLFINESGTADAAITLTEYGAGSNPPTFDGNGTLTHIAFLRGSYIAWDGIRGEDATIMVGEVTGDNVTVKNSYFTDNGRAFTTREGADDFRFTNNTCAYNNRMIVNDPGGAEDYGANCVVLVGSNGEIDHNVCYGQDAPSYDYVRDGACIEVFGASGGRFHDNLAYDNHTFAELGKPGSDTSCTDNRFWNNVIRGSSTYSQSVQLVVHVGGAFGPCTYTVFDRNSVSLSNASRGIGLYGVAANGTQALTIRNNPIRSYEGSAIGVLGSGGSVADSYNHFFGGSVAWALGTGSTIADPLFVSATDLHLQGGSPSIDSGASLGYTADVEGNPIPGDGNCDGTAEPDRGAYEYQNGGC